MSELELAEIDSLLPQSSDAVNWIVENFRIPETPDKRLILHPYQRACLNEALRKVDGKFVYSTVLWSDIKKSIKSTIAAAVVLWRAYHTEWAQILVIANDIRQADSRVGYYIRRAIELNPTLNHIAKIKNYEIRFLHNHAVIESIPIDPTGEAGSNADMVVFSELWGAHHKAQLRMWTESTLPPAKFGYSQRWIESYAGFQGESEVLTQLYEAGTKDGTPLKIPNAPDDLEVWENKAARLFCLWNTKPRLSWQTPEYYAQEAAILTPNEFNRVHRNQWSSSTNAFVPIQWWDACKVDSIPDVGRRGVVIGVDAARANDCFAVVIVTSHNNKVQVLYCHIWKPIDGKQINFAEIEDELLRLFKLYNVIEIAYDPADMTSMSQRLSGMVFWREFKQGNPRIVSDKLLYDLIRDRRIEHNGDGGLREHIQNADAKPDDEKVRIVKRNEKLKIDACVSLSMAADRALHYNL